MKLVKDRPMKSVYVLTFLKTKDRPEERYYFTSLIAIFTKFDKKKLTVSYSYIRPHGFNRRPFENKYIRIEKVYPQSKEDILREREKEQNTFLEK